MLLSEENKVPRTLFEGREVAGSATYKQGKTDGICAALQGQFVYSVMKTKRVGVFILFKHKTQSVKILLL